MTHDGRSAARSPIARAPDHDVDAVFARAAPAGLTPPSTPEGRTGFLSDVIVELGFADQATVERAVRAARSPGSTVTQVLLEEDSISKEQLAHAIAERHGLAYVDLNAYDVDAGAANLLKPGVARRYRSVGIGFAGSSLLVAMADPADALGLRDLGDLTGRAIVAAVAAGPVLDALIDSLPLPEVAGSSAPPPPIGAEPAAETDAVELGPASEPGELDQLRARLAAAEAASRTLEDELSAARLRLAAVQAEHQVPLPQPEPPAAVEATAEAELQLVRLEVQARSDELTRLRAKLSATETEAVRVRADADTRAAELESARVRTHTAEQSAEEARRRATEAEAGAEEARRRATDAERAAQEARVRADELQAADRRAEQARLALADLRVETEREHEHQALVERDLRAKATSEERRRRLLEERLSEVESGVFAAERAFEELRQAQSRMRGSLRALTEPDSADDLS